MLFQNKIEPHCVYCRRGRPLSDGQVICPKHGVVSPEEACKSFDYDPLKRVPPRPAPPQPPRVTLEELDL